MEGSVDACKDRNKFLLKCLYGMFSSVVAVNIRREKLKLDMLLLFDYAPVFSTGFVVEDL